MKIDENHRKGRFTMVFVHSGVKFKDGDRSCHIIRGFGGVLLTHICLQVLIFIDLLIYQWGEFTFLNISDSFKICTDISVYQ